MPATEKLVPMATFGAPHGVRGELRLKSGTADPLGILRQKKLRLGDGQPVRLLGGRIVKDDILVVRVAGIGTREAAARLTNQTVFLPRAALPPPEEEDEFYHADLIGLAAQTEEGTPLGHVIALHTFGAGDVVEVRDGAGANRLYPFTRAVVPVVDIAGGRIVIVPPAEIEARGPDDPTEDLRDDAGAPDDDRDAADAG